MTVGTNISIRQAEAADASGVAQLMIDNYKIGYRGQLPDDYIESPKLYYKLMEQRHSYYTMQGDARPVCLLAHMMNLRDVTTDKPVLAAMCEAGPLREYPGQELIESYNASETLEVWTNYVSTKAQGQGIGRELFVETLAAAYERFPSCRGTIVVLTFVGNTAGRRFYEKFGGRLAGIIPNYTIDGKHYRVACYEWHNLGYWLRQWKEKSNTRNVCLE
ncbi:hypothetical protein BZG36_00111 [Bifiguratus adelaidae]|uniref:N-acetyltransferase domain-containing protein n=1 Tax=Bifiguratus adelaidae TaxID=1938954 RepID=A0A261Y8P3_9FUNG|nr:hypothetical protein BZG36_00111 [Bifiguratus adelaidae]